MTLREKSRVSHKVYFIIQKFYEQYFIHRKISSPSHVQSVLEKCPRFVEIKHNTNIDLKLNEYSYTHYRDFHINASFP